MVDFLKQLDFSRLLEGAAQDIEAKMYQISFLTAFNARLYPDLLHKSAKLIIMQI